MAEPRILLVDPDPDGRAILAIFLEHQGFRTFRAASGDEGLRMAVRHTPELILGEHPLHLADGRTLCTALHDLPATAHTPFIAVTARAMPRELCDARRCHPAGVLVKPLRLGEILRAVERALRQPA